jgi:hypothetical protein
MKLLPTKTIKVNEMNDYKGEERRKVDSDLRDIIIESRNDLKHMVEWSKGHTSEDNTRFKLINDKVSKIEQFVWMSAGGLALLTVFLKLIPAWYQISK